jgi:DNA polymerase-3 subunit gamma/tau
MFENVLNQPAVQQIRDDFEAGRLAPSMLFFGPPASGKGTAALEVARALSCENPGNRSGAAPGTRAPWNCPCSACGAHRFLAHLDLLMLGPRSFAPEIAACRAAFLRGPESSAVPVLFIRSVRKLLARFSPVLWEDDPRAGKISPLAAVLEEDLNDLDFALKNGKQDIEKICASIEKNALKLENEGMGEYIPIGQIRRAAYWSRLAPSGRRKILLIENAGRMREEARNSLLKILEEPPETLTIILTVSRRETILPTLLSRLRPYRFLRRSAEVEAEVIRRVFRDRLPEQLQAGTGGLIGAYLDSFLSVTGEKLYSLAAFYIAALVRNTASLFLRGGISELPEALVLLGKYNTPIAESAGLGRSDNVREIIPRIITETGNFGASSFSRFLGNLLSLVSGALRGGNVKPGFIPYIEMWRKNTGEADLAVGSYNQSPALALERLFFDLREAMISVRESPLEKV